MLEQIQDLLLHMPVTLHGAMAIVFAAGLVIWAFGRRLIRPAIALSAVVAGAALGFFAASYLPHGIAIWWPVAAGAIVLGMVGIGAYRLVIASLLAISLGLAAPLGYYAWAETTGRYADEVPADSQGPDLPGIDDPELNDRIRREVTDEIDRRARDYLDRPQEDAEEAEPDEEAGPQFDPEWRELLDKTRGAMLTTAAEKWAEAPPAQRWATIITALTGAAVGLVVGLFLPGVAGAAVTSIFGGLIVLSAGFWLAVRANVPVETFGPTSPTSALIWWLGAAVIGLAIQLSLGARKADKG